MHISVRRAKYTIHYQVINGKVAIEKHMHFSNNCNINAYTDCYHLLKIDKGMIIIKNSLYCKFINKAKPKLKKKIRIQLLVLSIDKV